MLKRSEYAGVNEDARMTSTLGHLEDVGGWYWTFIGQRHEPKLHYEADGTTFFRCSANLRINWHRWRFRRLAR